MARELCEDKSRNTVSSTGFCYSPAAAGNPSFQTHFTNQIQEFAPNPVEIFSLTTNMEIVGFSKNLHQQTGGSSVQWKGFSTKSNFGSSSSKTINESSSFYDHDYDKQDFSSTSENLMAGVGPETGAWQENRFFLDDSSLRCVLNGQGNERPSHGLSLSLSSDNPSGIGLHSFVELRQTQEADERFVSSMTRSNGFLAKANNIQQQEQIFRDGLVGKVADLHQHGQFHLGNSKYLIPTQQLLNEFCSLGLRNGNGEKKDSKTKQWVDENATASLRKQSLQSLDFIELQKRKTRLFSMMEELERRYRHYCDQMKMVVSSFEGVAGDGAANVYSALACKALSRHFRCLKDGIVTQIQAVKKAMGEKDQLASVPGASKGETPRLCILDQTLRRQRAFQQMSLMESHPWRPQRGLPERSVSILRAWLFEHFLHPYPSDVDKHILARQTGLSRSQVSNWFINARVRLWKPMVEDMYLEEVKEQENNLTSSDRGIDIDIDDRGRARPEDQKPTADQLLRINSDCLSSIINNPPKNDAKSSKTTQNHHQQQHQNFSSFGMMELDFSSYNHPLSGAVSYASDSQVNHNFNGSGGGVSLTLGLQQHGGNGSGSLPFSSPPQTNSLFYHRDSMEECQPSVHYSLFDGEAQNLPSRNLMEAQMFHDLAG